MSILSRSRASLSRLYALGTPAATVVVLRDSAKHGVQCLLVQKSKAQRFGSLWVFPGGAVEESDQIYHADTSEIDVVATATKAAVRELFEETQLQVLDNNMALFSHWMPPAAEAKARGKAFSTFFLAGEQADDTEVQVCGGEIVEHQWLTARDALALHADRRLPLLPPTWMTLDTLDRCCMSAAHGSAQDVLRALHATEARSFETRRAQLPDGRSCFMWDGDAGFEESDPAAPGKRFRMLGTVAGPPPQEGWSSTTFELVRH
jgi:8-oxo-dGTP pyrophosphatase MutT (NUDIX family)